MCMHVLVCPFNKDKYEQVNFSSGRYFSKNSQDLGSRLPFDAGFEVHKIFYLESQYDDSIFMILLKGYLDS